MQQIQVVVANQVRGGLLPSTAAFPVCVPMPLRTAMSMPTVPVAAAMSIAVEMPSATGPSRGIYSV